MPKQTTAWLPGEAVAAAGSPCLGTGGLEGRLLASGVVCVDSSSSSWLQHSGCKASRKRRESQQLALCKELTEKAPLRFGHVSPTQRSQPEVTRLEHSPQLPVDHQRTPDPRAFPEWLLPGFVSHSSPHQLCFCSGAAATPSKQSSAQKLYHCLSILKMLTGREVSGLPPAYGSCSLYHVPWRHLSLSKTVCPATICVQGFL